MTTREANKALVRRYYEEMWNRWDLSIAEEVLAPGMRFRGSLGTVTEGIRGFCRYARAVWLGFPDFHNEVVEMAAAGGVELGMDRAPLGELGDTGRGRALRERELVGDLP